MTQPPAHGLSPEREGSHGRAPGPEGSPEQATGGPPPVSSPRPDDSEGASGRRLPTSSASGWSTSPSFVAPARIEVVDSTNRYLADLARKGAPEGLSVVADRQTAGRGRLQREWVDVPGGSLLCSMLFRPAMELDRWHLVSMLVALAGLDACADAAGVDARCKWPNDVVVEGRKLGGILAEVVPSPAPAASGSALVVGIGLNCNWGDAWEAPPLGLGSMATSLDRVAGRPIDRSAVEARLLERVAQRYAALTGKTAGAGQAPERSLAAEYRRKLDTVGRVVRIELPDEVFTGRALDVDDAGRLLVDVGMCTRTVEAGDVVHLR